MAIDTTAKRRSALFFGRGFVTAGPTASMTQADQQEILGFYRGILATVLAITASGIAGSVEEPSITGSALKPSITGSVTA